MSCYPVIITVIIITSIIIIVVVVIVILILVLIIITIIIVTIMIMMMIIIIIFINIFIIITEIIVEGLEMRGGGHLPGKYLHPPGRPTAFFLLCCRRASESCGAPHGPAGAQTLWRPATLAGTPRN